MLYIPKKIHTKTKYKKWPKYDYSKAYIKYN